MNYKLIACDLDGTLFDAEGKLSEENSRVIAELAELCVYFVPSSGRTFSDIPEAVRNHPSVRYIIHSSGAVVYDKQTDSRISFCMPNELSQSVLKMLRSTETHLSVRRLGATYVDSAQMTPESFDYYNVWSVHSELLLDYAKRLDDFENEIMTFDNVEMISVFFKNDDDLEAIRKILDSDKRLNVVSACPHNLEIIYSEASKGKALRALAEQLSISIDETIAVGDSENDIAMLTAAGLGLAMDNAKDMVKENADAVICNNNQHAVKFIKEKYIAN